MRAFSVCAVLCSLALAIPAFAAEEEETPEDTPKPKPKPKAKPKADAEAPTTPAPTASAAASVTPDHEKVTGRLGIGYLGALDVPLGTTASLPAHIIGVRYWTSGFLAITGGLGFASASSSTTAAGTTNDGPAATAFALKGGVALALATGAHYAFVLEPQLVIGYATQKVKPAGGGGDTENTGTRVAIGATAGAEIQFGFIGIPELALIGSVGLAFDTQSAKTRSNGGEIAGSKTSISTFSLANPWNIFSGNVAAIYYF